jgi:hypothetical protein
MGLLPSVDGRSVWARRLHDLMLLHLSDLGGETNYSEAEKALVGRASCLIVELEHMEMRFALKDGASPDQLKVYQMTVNTLRRTLDRAAVEGPRMHRFEIAYIILGSEHSCAWGVRHTTSESQLALWSVTPPRSSAVGRPPRPDANQPGARQFCAQ